MKSNANLARSLNALGAIVSLILVSVAASTPAAHAQGPPQYELTVLDADNTIWPPEWPPIADLRPYDVNEMGVVVGYANDLFHADLPFMYVHATGRMYDLNHLDNAALWMDLETNSPTVDWFARKATGINESNQIVGIATNIDPNIVDRYFVLGDPLGPSPTFQLLPPFGNTDPYDHSGRINDHGVVAGYSTGGVGVIVYDPADNYEPVHTGGTTFQPRDINNDGVIVCGGVDEPAQIIEPIGLGNYVVHEFPEFQPLAFSGINDLGIVTGFQFETGRGRNKVVGGPIRFDFELYQQDPTVMPELLITTGGYNFNWGGDVNSNGDMYFGHDGRGFLFLEGQGSFPIDDYVLFDTPQEEAYWFSNGGALPSGITDNGKLICWSDDKGFLLTPISNEPVPGITVAPTSALATTESGSTAMFTVRLDTPPAADVTIEIRTEDATEGLIDDLVLGLVEVSSLTFTTGNWDQPQSVTIVGVQDLVPDGDIAYFIEVGVTASADLEYLNLAPVQVELTNEDDEVPAALSVNDPSIVEGDNGDQTTGEFTITLSQAATGNEVVSYQVSNGSAIRNKDYQMIGSTSGLLRFAAGETTKTIAFVILGDNRRESNETFSIQLTDSFGATIAKSVGVTTILDDD